MWKGDNEPTTFPHLCPFRPDGVDKQTCIELSGGNQHQNINGCCGASRNQIYFGPCNSIARRCVICLQMGRCGSRANAVTSVAAGTCDEHVSRIQSESARIPVRQARSESIAIAQQSVRPASLNEKKPGVILPTVRKEEVRVEESIPAVSEVTLVPVAFEKKRRKPAEKLTALEQAAAELRMEETAKQPEGAERDIQLTARELISRAAEKLRMSWTGLSTYFYRSVPAEIRDRWLYSKRKRTRGEIKFEILMQVREQLRQKGGAVPRKKELAEAAAKPLGMTLDSARTYIYDRLTPEEVKALDLRGRFLSLVEQVDMLKCVRKEMKEKGLPPPRSKELAETAAPLLRQKVNSVKTLIGSLSEEIKEELELSESRSGMLAGVDPALVQEAFIGAVAILKLRRMPLTTESLRLVLKLKPQVVTLYLNEHPEVKELLEHDGT